MTLESIAYIAALAWLAVAGLMAERSNRRLRNELLIARARLAADREGT